MLEEEEKRWKATEKENVAKLTRLRNQLESLEREKAAWKNNDSAATPRSVTQLAKDGGQAATTTPAAALMQIEILKARIKALEAAVRFHRSAAHTSSLSSHLDYLAEPLVPHTTTAGTHISRLKRESQSLYKDLIAMATSPEAQLIRLPELRKKEERLQWRPVKEGAEWRVMRQREGLEWWREGVKNLANDLGRRNRVMGKRRKGTSTDALKEEASEVRIVGVDLDGEAGN